MRTHGHREGSITHWGLLGGIGEGQRGSGSCGRIEWGEMPNVYEWEEGSKTHCHMCTYATILHVLHMYPQTENAIKKKKRSEVNMYKDHTHSIHTDSGSMCCSKDTFIFLQS